MFGMLAGLGSALGSAAGALASTATQAIAPIAKTVGEGVNTLNNATQGLGGLQGIGSMLSGMSSFAGGNKNNGNAQAAQNNSPTTFIKYMPPTRRDDAIEDAKINTVYNNKYDQAFAKATRPFSNMLMGAFGEGNVRKAIGLPENGIIGNSANGGLPIGVKASEMQDINNGSTY